MKLRVLGNSLRLRLKPSEVTRLLDEGLVEERTDFGGGCVLAYRLQAAGAMESLRAEFRDGTLAVLISRETAQLWAASNEIGIYGHAGAVSIAIEKDLRCLTRPEAAQERDSYPNPGGHC